MNEVILIDIGSSTVKVYKKTKDVLSLVLAKSIPFKNGFKPGVGISEISKNELIKLVKKIKTENKKIPIKIYATAIFRKFDKKIYQKFADDFFKKTTVKFRIISQDLENKYLKEALIGKFNGKKPVLLINIGGGSTELVVIREFRVLETKNIDLGVGTVLNRFPTINESGKKATTLAQVKDFVGRKLPVLRYKVKIGFYSGGELTYMKLAGYKLKKNNLFIDKSHPHLISLSDFAKRNKLIYTKISLKALEKMMPQNPTWMQGARACSAFAESICEKFGVEMIIPSDANLIDGVVRRDYDKN